jgi:uncharacterized protein
MIYIERTITNKLLETATYFPIVAIIGARQVGKTTLIKKCFPEKEYFSFEPIANREYFNNDPWAFFERFKNGAFFDEVQHVPDLFSYLQTTVDNNQLAGQFIVSGSQNLFINEKIAESLSGRVGIIKLFPFTLNELAKADLLKDTINSICSGWYPPIYSKNIPSKLWYPNYIDTYIEKDVRKLLNIRDIYKFRKFLEICASSVGEIFVLENIIKGAGISKNTAYHWLGVLEQTFIIYFLRPSHKNYKKRIVKSPKLYFYDTGLICSLLNLTEKNIQNINNIGIYGHLFENMIVSEIKKELHNLGLSNNLYYWRDDKGKNEVDLLIEKNQKYIPIEIKSSKTPKGSFATKLNIWINDISDNSENGYLIYGGDEKRIMKNSVFIPWEKVECIYKHILSD